jgi:DNA-binding response OmpR family regulator
MKVLLVDDDIALQTVVSAALTQGGFEVVSANDGKTGIDKAKSEKPDMILLDQVLPDISGNNILKTLKADDETKNIPIAMLSNFSQNNLMQEAIQAGALDYILKYQIEPADLVQKINSLIKESQSGKPTPQAS